MSLPLANCFCVFFSASSNQITMEGVLMLAGALCSHNNLTQIHIRYFLFYVLGTQRCLDTSTSDTEISIPMNRRGRQWPC